MWVCENYDLTLTLLQKNLKKEKKESSLTLPLFQLYISFFYCNQSNTVLMVVCVTSRG